MEKLSILDEGGNVIGEEYNEKKSIEKKYKFYDYFKKSIKPMRKMGHYTILKKLTP